MTFFNVWNDLFPSVGRFLIVEVLFANKPSFRQLIVYLGRASEAILNSQSSD